MYLQSEEQDGKPSCTHGEAPADTLWGIEERRTSAEVRASRELSGSLAHPGGNGGGVQSAVSPPDVSAASLVSDATGRRSAGGGGASTAFVRQNSLRIMRSPGRAIPAKWFGSVRQRCQAPGQFLLI